jgi:RHS repeat-associated protein
VVESIRTLDPWSEPVETRYLYHDPVATQDWTGRWGFRGFARTEAIGPTGAVTEDEYGYDVDATGRRVATTVYEDGVHATRVSQTSWKAYELSSITTYHPVVGKEVVCRAGATKAACLGAGATSTSLAEWAPIGTPTVAYVGRASAVLGSDVPVVIPPMTDGVILASYTPKAGDVLAKRTHVRFANGIVRETHSVKKDLTSGKVVGESDVVFDALGRVALWTSERVDDERMATTERTYDMTLGNLLTVRRPRHVAAGVSAKTSYAYSGIKLYPDKTTNELFHETETTTDYGTGIVLLTRGPNQKGGIAELSRIVVDGLGRTVETWESVDEPAGYRLLRTAGVQYYDFASPARVQEERLISEASGSWTKTVSEFDSYGRILRKSDTIDASTAATQHFFYDKLGKLKKVTTPDPSLDGATVDWAYEYDALGRSKRLTGPDGQGVAFTYDGLVATREDVVPAPAPDPIARTELVTDPHGRLVQVKERLDDGSYATTTYQHDANDRLVKVTDADGLVTELENDLLGHRTAVVRSGRTWRWKYDLNGNLTDEISPSPTMLAPAYTTISAYDQLDRLLARFPATRDFDFTKKSRWAIGPTTYQYDDPAQPNAIGRLSKVVLPFGTVRYAYDAGGRVTQEEREIVHYNLGMAIVAKGRVRTTYNAMGLPEQVEHADGDPGAGLEGTVTRTEYDKRALPSRLLIKSGGSFLPLATLARNVAGLVKERRSGGSADVSQEWSYNANGAVTDHAIYGQACAVSATWKSTESWIEMLESDAAYYKNYCDLFKDEWWCTQYKSKQSEVDAAKDQLLRERKRKWTCLAGTRVVSGGESLVYTKTSAGEVESWTSRYAGTTLGFTYDAQHQLRTAVTVAGDPALYSAYFEDTPGGRPLIADIGSNGWGTGVLPRSVRYPYSDRPEPSWAVWYPAGSPDPAAVKRLVPDGATEPTALFRYDEGGNLVFRLQKDLRGVFSLATSLSYDGEDKVREIDPDSSSQSVYFYDHGGARVVKAKWPTLPWLGRATVWLGDTEIEYDWYGKKKKTTVHVALGGMPIAQIRERAALVPKYTHSGVLGSLLAVLTPEGEPLARYSYGPFGEVLDEAGPEIDDGATYLDPDHQTRAYEGKEFDFETRLSYYGARYYDRYSLTWTQGDPLYRFAPDLAYDEPRRMGLYTFNLNNPLRYVDPDGLWPGLAEKAAEIAFETKATLNGIGSGSSVNGAKSGTLVVSGAPDTNSRLYSNGEATEAAAGEAIEAVFVEPLCAVAGCNPANAPDQDDVPESPKSFTDEAVNYGSVFALGVGGKLLGKALKGLGAAAGRGLGGASTWGRAETLADHFARHGDDFGARTANEYAEAASSFLRRSQAERLPTKIDSKGIIRVYDKATNTFGAYNPNGTTATFFKPAEAASYWAKQPGVAQ